MKLFATLKNEGGLIAYYEKAENRHHCDQLFVVAVEQPNGFNYLAFEYGLQEFIKYMCTKSTELYFHEVIMGHKKQRLRVDIDGEPGSQYDEADLIESLKIAITLAINDLWAHNIAEDSIIITTSSGMTPNGYKHSYHLIVNGCYIVNGSDLKQFTSAILGHLPDKYHRLVDQSTAGSIKNFRIPYCSKIGSNRPKRQLVKSLGAQQFVEACIITNVQPTDKELKLLTPVEQIREYKCADLPNDIFNSIMDKLKSLGITTNWSYRQTGPSIIKLGFNGRIRPKNCINIYFDRIRPEHCKICNRQHDTDHTLFISVVKSKSTYCINQRCRRNLDDSILITRI